jgi:hypothetical protein
MTSFRVSLRVASANKQASPNWAFKAFWAEQCSASYSSGSTVRALQIRSWPNAGNHCVATDVIAAAVPGQQPKRSAPAGLGASAFGSSAERTRVSARDGGRAADPSPHPSIKLGKGTK